MTGGYAAALVVAAGLALASDDVGLLWRLSLFTCADEDAAATWPIVTVLVLAGGLWAWALWQSLRGLPFPKPFSDDRETRSLQWALFAAVAFWAFYAVMPIWPWWAVVLDALLMSAVMVLFHPVLRRVLRHADLALGAGLLAQVCVAVTEVADALDWPQGWRTALDDNLTGLGTLVWCGLALVAQRRDGRWGRTTVWYGVASQLAPFVLLILGQPLMEAGDLYGVYDEATSAAADALFVIWLARSAHELAGPYGGPAPYAPPAGGRAALTSAARLTACVVLLLPPLANYHAAWIGSHVPIDRLARDLSDVAAGVSPALLRGLDLFVGLGGLAVPVLVALHRRAVFWPAMGALLLTAFAGPAAMALTGGPDPGLYDGWVLTRPDGADPFGTTFPPPLTVSPLWVTAACLVSAALLLWSRASGRLPGKG
ncbi:hypothetical protein [Microbispora amethystogenes]|uniref:hypothetical protein n=1 Tax=Microbispora amethystogenes TaxID=1427754 RepID=UPI001953C366|nr:hypothetical protein [Microbispora amethystogenes]